MDENISYKLTEIERPTDNTNFLKLYDDLDKIILDEDDNMYENSGDTVLDKFMAYKLDYTTNYTVIELRKILDYYIAHFNGNLPKIGKRKKEDLVENIVEFELDNDNMELVCKRKRLWFYIKEIKNDKYLSKYIIFN